MCCDCLQSLRGPSLIFRHSDTFPPQLRGYEQKRHRGCGDSEVSRPMTFAKPFPTGSEVDGEPVQRKFTFLFGEICKRIRQ